MPIQLLHRKLGAVVYHLKLLGLALGGEEGAGDRFFGTNGYFDVVQGDYILDSIEFLAAPFRDIAEEVDEPAVVLSLVHDCDDRAAGGVVAHQGVGQEDIQRVEKQALAPERSVLVVLSKDGMSEINGFSSFDDAGVSDLPCGWCVTVGAEMLEGAVEVGTDHFRQNFGTFQWFYLKPL